MKCRAACALVGLGFFSTLSVLTLAQNKTAPGAPPAPPALTVDYPSDRVGILILAADWISIPSEMPTKNRLKHALAPVLTYGAVPAVFVADYEGLHAQVHIEPGRPVICVCHFISLPGNPALVRLHVKKDFRELDGGKIRIGTKIEEAEKNDLIPVAVSRPEDTVWLVQPQESLPAGEYAVMLGTQNVSIFPFTIPDAGNTSTAPAKH